MLKQHMTNQFLVILRGSPASGKSTIAKRLRSFSKKIAWLKVDNFKDFFSNDASQALLYVNGASNATLEYLLEQGFSVVIDGVFQDTNALDQSLKIADRFKVKTIVYEIVCSLDIILDRDKNRAGVKEGCRQPLDDNTLTTIYKKITANRYRSAVELNTEHLSIDECLTKIQSDINNQN